MCDPESWIKPITSTNFIIHRTIGIHPKYTAPTEFFNDVKQILLKLIKTNFFSAISTGYENNNHSISCITDLYKNGCTSLPLFIQSRNDIEITKFLDQEHLLTIPIIWQNANLGLENRYQTVIDTNSNKKLFQYLEHNENHFLCINSLINSHPIHKLHQLVKQPLLDRILATTDTPHNVFAQKYQNKAPHTQPIHVVRTIIQLHYQLINLKNFKKYKLYETNEWLFNKSINLFPAKTTQSPTQYTIAAKHIASSFLEKWSTKLKYEKINIDNIPKTNKYEKVSIPPLLKPLKDSSTQTDEQESVTLTSNINNVKHIFTQTDSINYPIIASPIQSTSLPFNTSASTPPTPTQIRHLMSTENSINTQKQIKTPSPTTFPLSSTQTQPTFIQTKLFDFNKENSPNTSSGRKRASNSTNIYTPKIQRKSTTSRLTNAQTNLLEEYIMQKSTDPDDILSLIDTHFFDE